MKIYFQFLSSISKILILIDILYYFPIASLRLDHGCLVDSYFTRTCHLSIHFKFYLILKNCMNSTVHITKIETTGWTTYESIT